MRVLHVISTLNARVGGTFTAVRDIAFAQARNGLCVTVCSVFCSPAERADLEKLQIEFMKQGVQLYFFKAVTSIRISWGLYKWLKNGLDFDFLHIHGLYRLPTTIAVNWARKTNVPYVVTPHGSLVKFLYKQSRYGYWGLKLKRIYEFFLEMPNLNNASVVHFTSEEEAAEAQALKIIAPYVVLPIGINLRLFRSLPEFGNFRKFVGVDCDTPLVLFLGRVDFKKGLDLLVKSFAKVVSQLPEARLVIVGPDSSGYLEKVHLWCNELNIKQKVIFIDYLDLVRVKEAYVDANVFVLPSYNENFGLTVIEAMACKCPVIISDQVNIWREIHDGHAGLVVQLNIDELANAMVNILNNPVLAKNMGLLGHILVKNIYDWDKIIIRFTDLYHSVISDFKVNKKVN